MEEGRRAGGTHEIAGHPGTASVEQDTVIVGVYNHCMTINIPFTSLAVLDWDVQIVHWQVDPLEQAGRVVVGGWAGQSVAADL